MKHIKLTQGKFTLVDDEDYEELSKHKWYAFKETSNWYAMSSTHKTHKTILMHRIIMNAQKGQQIDHKNGNGLDNRRHNLRLCTRSQNQHNQAPHVKSEKSKYKGVSIEKRNTNKKWRATIGFDCKSHFIGYFAKETDAAKAYDIKALELFGEFAKINFPFFP